MTTTYHTPIATGAAANASTINTPLGQLDAAVVALEAVYGLDGAIAGPITVTGNTTVSGTLTATTLLGDGSALTGIASGTGGIINTGSTTIGADSDSDGAGEIALQTRGVTRVTVANGGTVSLTGALNTAGAIHAAADIKPTSGASATLLVDATCYDNAGGSQWASMFARNYTTAGESMATNQLDGLLTCLYHYEDFEVQLWKGIETGGAYVGNPAGGSGAACVLTTAYGLDANIPTVTADATVHTAAAIHVASKPTTGMTHVYAILSDLVATSLFSGKIEIEDVSLAIDAHREGGPTTFEATAYQTNANSGGQLYLRFANNTLDSPGDVTAGDQLGKISAYGYLDAGFQEMASIRFRADTGAGAGSYASKIQFLTTANADTSPNICMLIEADGTVTTGGTAKGGTTAGNLFTNKLCAGANTSINGQIHGRVADAAAIPVLYLHQEDVSEDFIRFRGTSAADNTQSLVDAADLEDPGAVVGWVKVYVQDDAGDGSIADGAYWMPFYATPTHSA